MIAFPLVATGISVVFAWSLFRRYAARRRLALLAWGISLTMFALASLAVAAALALDWDATIYRFFWLFGALLNVPWLAVGSVSLVSKRAVGWGAVAIATAASAYAAVHVFSADLDRALLATEDGIPRGREVWLDQGQVDLARWYSIVAWIVVVGIALYTSRSRKGLKPPADRVKGNILIAVGVSVVALGGFALSRIGRGSAFSVSLALGVVLMYAGFLFASRAPRYTVESPGESPT